MYYMIMKKILITVLKIALIVLLIALAVFSFFKVRQKFWGSSQDSYTLPIPLQSEEEEEKAPIESMSEEEKNAIFRDYDQYKPVLDKALQGSSCEEVANELERLLPFVKSFPTVEHAEISDKYIFNVYIKKGGMLGWADFNCRQGFEK